MQFNYTDETDGATYEELHKPEIEQCCGCGAMINEEKEGEYVKGEFYCDECYYELED